MDHDKLARLSASITDCFGAIISPDNKHPVWFIAYGALLWLCRDKPLGKDFETDLDIVCLTPGCAKAIESVFNQYSFITVKKVLNDVTGEPLEIAFKPTPSNFHLPTNVHIDIFFWHEANQYYWHTYDYYGEGKNTLSKYMFKGIPKWLVSGKVLWKYIEEIAPMVPIPAQYGSLLHCWYGDWLKVDPSFGQSLGDQVAIRSCKDIKNLKPKHNYYYNPSDPVGFWNGIDAVMAERKNGRK